MKRFKLSNSTLGEMFIAFEPIGDHFILPSNDHLEFLVFDEEVGIGPENFAIDIDVTDNKIKVKVFAEKNTFEALYKGEPVNIM